MPDKEESMQAAGKAAAGIPPEAMKAAAQAADNAPEGSAQAAQEAQKAIVVNTDIDENAPEVTPEEIAAAIQNVKLSTDDIAQTVHEAFSNLNAAMSQTMLETLSNTNDILRESMESVAKILESYNFDVLKIAAKTLKESAQALDEIFKSDEWKEFETLFPGITTDDFFNALVIIGAQYDPEGTPTIDGYIELFRELTRLLPYIPAVLEAYKKESGLKEITFIQFLENKDPATGKPAESLFNKCLQQAAGPDFIKELPILKGVVPENYIITNDLVSNSMTKGLVNAGSVSLDPSQGHKGKYKVYAAITLDPNKYAVNGNFTKYDRRVFNGYCSLMAAGNAAFTAEMVYRAMNGLSNTEYVSPQQIAAVTKSLDKQRKIDIFIDATEEFKKRKIIDPDSSAKVTFKAACLEARIITVSAGGKEKSAYMPLAKPVLYDYSDKLNQIISVSSDRLVIKDKSGGRISNTDNFTAIREYLLQRIEIMKSQKRRGQKVNTTIDINTFYEETDNDSANGNYKTPAAEQTAVRKKKLKAREQAAQCLDYWTRTDYINGYKMREKKHVVTAIEIQL